jgi:hypothetical protein
VRDEIIVYEIMTAKLDRDWWTKYGQNLEKVFRQNEIVVRAIAFDKL